ncbi:isoleucyl-tRNA synthetase [Piedraia hortae CBS 480.64]|uniref:isoleucine--tRNA ligase n=1 Tax=Piedraia hortae CBS 480.64 TaxID=1314780 RepID=A0A6A7C0B7_9PEZI|nr:isoleucyl-tRNA synthetase [Piedraia hortae CBS 480.64]
MLSFHPTRSLSTNWTHTLHLPKTTFPARATLSELETYRRRCSDDLYTWQKTTRKGKPFILLDGPPYANGPVHMGHAVNKILKDMILRWEVGKGRRVSYRPGWDCHGLPIELKALQEGGADDIRVRARGLASETVEVQKASFKGWGVMGEWEEPYKTMDHGFEVQQLGVLREMVRRGLVSRRFRPVHWSPSTRTALAEAELEYDDLHRTTAAFVKLPFVKLPRVLRGLGGRVSALVWTTTPWTLPANKAVAVHGDVEYVAVKVGGEAVVVAKERLEHVLGFLRWDILCDVLPGVFKGAELADGQATCYNLFQGTESPLLSADFVTSTSGTGLVHIAPGHGMDDYHLCENNGIGPAFAPVDDAGCYTDDVFPRQAHGVPFGGLDAQTKGSEAVLDLLSSDVTDMLPDQLPSCSAGLLWASHDFTHKYPIDWRTKQPVIIRATAQWFADVSALQQPARESLENVQMIPPTARTRLDSFLMGRSQWCISRQRTWGVPIPVLYHKEAGEANISDASIQHIIAVLRQRGIDAWFGDAEDDAAWLHSSLERGKWIRGKDTMDVWFDSGTTWTTLEDQDRRPLCDVVVEGTDQHRGWFQSTLLTRIAVDPTRAPYAKLITHGFVLDSQGKKMSKSIGNVVSPQEIIDGTLLPKPKKGRNHDSLGPDSLRLWVASADYTHDISLSTQQLQEVKQNLQKYRVTFKWLLGLLSNYNGSPPSTTDFADRLALNRMQTVSFAVRRAYDKYEFYKGVKAINDLIHHDLSAFYFETIKDVLYAGRVGERMQKLAVLYRIALQLLELLGPVTPHLVEEVWEHFSSKPTTLHPLKEVCMMPTEPPEQPPKGAEFFTSLSTCVKAAQEEARRAGHLKSGLACKVRIVYDIQLVDAEQHALLQDPAQLAQLLVVSQVQVMNVADAVESQEWCFSAHDPPRPLESIQILPPDGGKCPRCWQYTVPQLEVDSGALCTRCREVVEEKSSVRV